MRLAVSSRGAEKFSRIWRKTLDNSHPLCYNKTIKRGLAAGE